MNKIRATVLFFVAGAFLCGICGEAVALEGPALELNNDGVDLIEKGDIDAAVAKIEQAHRLAPDSTTVSENLAGAYLRQAEKLVRGEKPEDAVHWLDKTLSLGVKNKTVKHNIAANYNEIANGYSRAGRWSDAISLLNTAVSLQPQSTTLRSNLGMALFNDNRRDEALREFEGVAADAPDNALAKKMVGMLLYWKGQMKEALGALEEAAKLNPGDREIKETLEKIKKEYSVEKEFDVDKHLHFTVSFDGRKDYRIGTAVISALDEAWSKVGSDFNFYPDERVAVVIYQNKQFQDLLNKSENVGGLYDGKIRVPVGGMDSERDWEQLRTVLLHEYAHVVVHFLTHNKCPLWLNEGIAEYESEQWDEGKTRRIKGALERGGFIPLGDLSAALKKTSDHKRVTLAYIEAFSIARFIVERYGVYSLRRILDAIDGGDGINEALVKALGVDQQRLEKEWRRALEGA
jgi:tetratricopeptide (TPR) repeat protein